MTLDMLVKLLDQNEYTTSIENGSKHLDLDGMREAFTIVIHLVTFQAILTP